MTWEELKEEAKKMGCCNTCIYDNCIVFNGWLYLYGGNVIGTEDDGSIVEQEIDVSYDQMLAIMKALQQEVV